MAKALVVDDNRHSADSMCSILNFLGLQAEAAYGARDGIVLLKTLIPDIIFLDIHMGGVSGFEVMGYLRRMPELGQVPVVFVTSDDQEETARKVRRTGALHLIIKPADVAAIEGVLKQAHLL
jgi:CheY-like chemotaxis protein